MLYTKFVLQQLQLLEMKVTEISVANEHLKEENQKLKEKVQLLETEVMLLFNYHYLYY